MKLELATINVLVFVFFLMRISEYLFIWPFIFKHPPSRFIYLAGRRRAVFINHSGQNNILTK